MKVTSCRFERAAVRPDDEPAAPGPHVVFLGRSNVGKSSLINRLLGVRGLARTSRRPGRTQSINFYRVNGWLNFVDLPGYGYAGVPEHVRRSWGPMVEGFLDRSQRRIALAFLVVDARHDPSELDLTMSGWLDARRVRHLVVATKADKLTASRRRAVTAAVEQRLGPSALRTATVLASAGTGLGMRELWRHLDATLERASSRRGTQREA